MKRWKEKGAYSKYKARRVKAASGTYASQKEYGRSVELRMLQKAGEISELREQVRYELIPAQYEATREVYKSGPRAGMFKKGRLLERPVAYVADFVYRDKDGNEIVEDTKGYRTKEYKIKRKLMLWQFGIRIKEV